MAGWLHRPSGWVRDGCAVSWLAGRKSAAGRGQRGCVGEVVRSAWVRCDGSQAGMLLNPLCSVESGFALALWLSSMVVTCWGFPFRFLPRRSCGLWLLRRFVKFSSYRGFVRLRRSRGCVMGKVGDVWLFSAWFSDGAFLRYKCFLMVRLRNVVGRWCFGHTYGAFRIE